MRFNFIRFADLLLLLVIVTGIAVFNTARADSIFDPAFGAKIDIFHSAEKPVVEAVPGRAEFDRQFHPYTGTSFNFGMLRVDSWLRITLPAGHQLKYLELDNPYLDRVRFYSPRKGGTYRMQQAGDSMNFADREINYRTFVFELDSDPQQQQVHYLNIHSTGAVHFLLNVWSEKGFLEYAAKSQGLIGLYYGILLVMAIYNFLIFLSIREISHLYYVIYTLTFGLFFGSISGVAFQYLWPEFPEWTQLSSTFFTGLVVIAAFQFSRSFLQTHVNAPIMDRVMLGLMALALAEILVVLFGDIVLAVKLAIGIGICLPPVIWLSGMICWLKGYRPARFLLIAWTFFLITVFASSLMNAGLLPTSFFTVYGMQIGSGIEIILLSLALSDKMALLKQGQVNAQLAYTSHLENYSQKLEKSVALRTGELQVAMELTREKNRALEEANRHLTELATHDGLTGLLNHHTFIEQFKHVVEDARRYKYSLVVIMIDLDHFKRINDTFGHLTGNDVLREVADIFKTEVRESDLAARYGGEEFTLILTRTSLAEARAKAENLRLRARELRLEHAPGLELTISIGLAALEHSNLHADYNLLLTQADTALYQAKQQGRDRVCSESQPLTVIATQEHTEN